MTRTTSPKAPVVLYIMGYGRSGSTILDILLGNHPDVVSVGELTYFRYWLSNGLTCSCGKALDQCPFWSSVIDSHRIEVSRSGMDPDWDVETLVEPRGRVWRFQRLNTVTGQCYRASTEALFRAIQNAAGGPRIVVDSSKSAGKAFHRLTALWRLTELDIRVIYLVRDGRGVVWSALRGAGTPELAYPAWRKIGRALTTTLSWTATNLWCLIVRRRLGSRVIQMRYEELVTDPEKQLNRIGRFLNLDMEPVISRLRAGGSFDPGHNVGGNRVRFQRRISFRADLEWITKLPWRHRPLFWLLAWPAALPLGYGLPVKKKPKDPNAAWAASTNSR